MSPRSRPKGEPPFVETHGAQATQSSARSYRLRWGWLLIGTVALALAGAWVGSEAATLDSRLVASGLREPLYATAPLADGRLFVVEKGGTIAVVQNGVTSSFLSIPVATVGEQGLLGLAFDPGYANPGSGRLQEIFLSTTSTATPATA